MWEKFSPESTVLLNFPICFFGKKAEIFFAPGIFLEKLKNRKAEDHPGQSPAHPLPTNIHQISPIGIASPLTLSRLSPGPIWAPFTGNRPGKRPQNARIPHPKKVRAKRPDSENTRFNAIKMTLKSSASFHLTPPAPSCGGDLPKKRPLWPANEVGGNCGYFGKILA
jgi:hypothetical protein